MISKEKRKQELEKKSQEERKMRETAKVKQEELQQLREKLLMEDYDRRLKREMELHQHLAEGKQLPFRASVAAPILTISTTSFVLPPIDIFLRKCYARAATLDVQTPSIAPFETISKKTSIPSIIVSLANPPTLTSSVTATITPIFSTGLLEGPIFASEPPSPSNSPRLIIDENGQASQGNLPLTTNISPISSDTSATASISNLSTSIAVPTITPINTASSTMIPSLDLPPNQQENTAQNVSMTAMTGMAQSLTTVAEQSGQLRLLPPHFDIFQRPGSHPRGRSVPFP